MNRDSRLSVALHVLLHMSEQKQAATSEALGALMGTNPVVIRRTLAGLRDAGIVSAEKGHGGGWSMVVDLRQVSLGDVYDALGNVAVFGIGVRSPDPRCPLERAVNHSVERALDEAHAVLMKRLHGVALADVLRSAAHQKRRSAPRGGKKERKS